MAPITEYNPFAPEVKEHPYPYYDWLRREHPVYYNARLGFWVLSRYEDVEAAARRPEVFSSSQGIGPDRRPGLTMIVKDPPEHTRLRKLISKAFTPRMVEQLAPRIRTLVDALLDTVIAQGSFDLIHYLAPDPDGVVERVDNPLFRGLKHYPLVFETARSTSVPRATVAQPQVR